MSFRSILFDAPEFNRAEDEADAPAFFADLNLDQVIDSITEGKEEYRLRPFFYTPLHDLSTVSYRQEVLRDLEGKALFEAVCSFGQGMRNMRECLAQAQKLHYDYQKKRWFLHATETFCQAIEELDSALAQLDLKSTGFMALRDWLHSYVGSPSFTSLVDETESLVKKLAEVDYCLHIKGNRIRVSRFAAETDYSADVNRTFEKFKQGAVKNYQAKFASSPDMNHVEAGVLGIVAELYPDVFAALDEYCDRFQAYLDSTIANFDREVQFYVAYLEYLVQFKHAGLSFCYPQVSESKEINACQTFDLALANKLIPRKSSVVTNDFYLKNQERVFVVSGPNQGGKTTFARTFGQLHYLASIGCLVPGEEAQLFLPDRLFTHFEKEEDLDDLAGKLQDDLLRIHEIFEQATGSSVLVMNEIFTSTTLDDALYLGREVMGKVLELDLLCVCVTFVCELAALSDATVSMVSMVVPDDPAKRTYKVVRRPADGLAHAGVLAEKYGLTYDSIKRRVAS